VFFSGLNKGNMKPLKTNSMVILTQRGACSEKAERLYKRLTLIFEFWDIVFFRCIQIIPGS
jgi:hypothetical protein